MVYKSSGCEIELRERLRYEVELRNKIDESSGCEVELRERLRSQMGIWEPGVWPH